MRLVKVSVRRHGFTLVELLFVLSIVALLMALLFPVFDTARQKSQQSVCASNLRQIGHSISLYAQDYDDLYPFATDPASKYTDLWDPSWNWLLTSMPFLHEALNPYVKERAVWRCPADFGFDALDMNVDKDGGPFLLDARPSCYEKYGASYSYNTGLVLLNARLYGTSAYERFPPYTEHGPAEVGIVWDAVGSWHSGSRYEKDKRLNALMGDGRVLYQTVEQYRRLSMYSLERPN